MLAVRSPSALCAGGVRFHARHTNAHFGYHRRVRVQLALHDQLALLERAQCSARLVAFTSKLADLAEAFRSVGVGQPGPKIAKCGLRDTCA